ncbi:hypothetical protein [Lentilactobacillus parafarraginis]|nr:hypothetical protein [Lentilactobacillus parafarraginis]
MEAKLFTNMVMVTTGADRVKQVLMKPQNMPQWVPEISIVDEQPDGFRIQRNEAALNQTELIRVTAENNQITYMSTEGRLEYRLVFTLTNENNQTVIQEDFYIPDDTDRHLPVRLLAPIAKHAFHTNLINLGSLVESMASGKE